jgi:hypothetical protein
MPLSLLWDEQSGQPKYSKAVSIEVSEHGLSVEAPQTIPTGTSLSLRSENGTLFGVARVKHAAAHGSKHIVGAEFGYGLLGAARALVRDVYSTPRMK